MLTELDLALEIEKLQPVERVRIIDRVIKGTINPDPEIEKIWVNEASARWQAFERGDVEPVPYAKVMSRYRHKR
jgi:hypothetical protein